MDNNYTFDEIVKISSLGIDRYNYNLYLLTDEEYSDLYGNSDTNLTDEQLEYYKLMWLLFFSLLATDDLIDRYEKGTISYSADIDYLFASDNPYDPFILVTTYLNIRNEYEEWEHTECKDFMKISEYLALELGEVYIDDEDDSDGASIDNFRYVDVDDYVLRLSEKNLFDYLKKLGTLPFYKYLFNRNYKEGYTTNYNK